MTILNVDLTVPPDVREAARQGLALRGQLGYGGSRTGERTAERLLSGKPLTVSKVRWMAAYFAKRPAPPLVGSSGNPHRMYVAWLLLGGDAGRTWVERTMMALTREETRMQTVLNKRSTAPRTAGQCDLVKKAC